MPLPSHSYPQPFSRPKASSNTELFLFEFFPHCETKKIQWKIVESFAEGIEINGGIDFCEKSWKLLSFLGLRFFLVNYCLCKFSKGRYQVFKIFPELNHNKTVFQKIKTLEVKKIANYKRQILFFFLNLQLNVFFSTKRKMFHFPLHSNNKTYHRTSLFFRKNISNELGFLFLVILLKKHSYSIFLF